MARRTNSRLLCARRLHELLDYDPGTGLFMWLEMRGSVKSGDVAGTSTRDGICIRVDCRRYPASHLAVLWTTGKWPLGEMNHRDGDDTNNRWRNLRPVDRSQKLWNRGKPQNNSTGFKGVTFHKGRGMYMAQIQVRGNHRFLGYFDTAEQAHRAYCRAARRLHGNFARTT